MRAGIERLGGTVALDSRRNLGVTVSFQLPQSRRVIDVHRLPSTQPGLTFAVPTTWMVRAERGDGSIDPAIALGLRRAGASVSATLAHIILARDGEEYPIVIGGSVTRVAAVRICPTSPDDGLEVVSVDDEKMLLIRPDAFFPSLRNLSDLRQQRRHPSPLRHPRPRLRVSGSLCELLVVEAGEEHDRRRFGVGPAEGAREIVAEDLRHLDVDDDEVRRQPATLLLEGLERHRGRDLVARVLESGLRHREDERAVVDEEDVTRHRARSRRP